MLVMLNNCVVVFKIYALLCYMFSLSSSRVLSSILGSFIEKLGKVQSD